MVASLVLRLPASQHGYSYAHNNPANKVDPSGMCSFDDSECREFVNDVRSFIDEGKNNNLSDWAIASLLADYYAGIKAVASIPYEINGCIYSVWIPLPTPWNRNEPIERHPVYPPYQTENWPYDPNRMENPNDRDADDMRAQYGFKRPYYQNTHHYFAVFYLELVYGFGLGPLYGRMYDEQQLQDLIDNGIPDQFAYEALWVDMHYDFYVNDVAAAHAHQVIWKGIQALPELIEKEMCANNEADVWSLQATVFSGEFEPQSKFAPTWERYIPIPGITP